MFSTIRNRLTLFFTGIMIIFLVSTNAISYYLLSSIIYNDQEKEIIRLSNLEVKGHAGKLLQHTATAQNDEKRRNESESESFKKLEKRSTKGDGEKAEQHTAITLHPFYYVLDWQGNWIAGDEPWSELQEEMIEYLKYWMPKPSEIRYKQIKVDDKNIHLIFSGQPIFKDSQYVGSIFTGADISQEAIVLRQYMTILISLSGVFLLVSVFLGYLMSGKAMTPIIRSFTKQQQFAADASHELRTPLSVILSSLEVIEAEEKARFSPFSRQVLDDLKDEVKRMSQLVANLLTLARADSSEIQLHVEVFSLNEELERLYRKFQPVAAVNRQQLQFDLPTELWISADRERLVQLLLILLDNAIQYSEKPGTITISAETRGKMLALSVSDMGKGIPADKQKDIFERFYRVDSSRTRTSSNAGLGLSIAKWIVEAHHGTIKIASEPGQGSTFTILLPQHV